MDKRQSNPKKTMEKNQKSRSQQFSAKPNNASKYDKKHNKSFGEKGFQDGNLSGKSKFEKYNVAHSVHPRLYQKSTSEAAARFYYDSDDEPDDFTSDFFKPLFKDNYHQNKNIESRNSLNENTIKEEIFSSVNQYKNSKSSFSKIYHKWLPERQSTIEKLHSLLKEVHDNATQYYETQATFKELSFNSRSFKQTTENQALDFFASFTAFITDAASGITSFAQVFEMDRYEAKFKEIMDHDENVTGDLYTYRSQCVAEYRDIEEVIRKYCPNTLTSTVDKISGTLHVDKHWTAMKTAYEENDMSKLLDEVCKFFDNACQVDVLENVGVSVNRYVTDNPAALEACKSTGKAVYGAINAFGEKTKNRNSAIGYVNKATNLYLMLDDKKEVDRLKSIIHEDTHQSKLESSIQEAIEIFETELKEMKDIYFKLFNIYDSD